MIVNIFTTFIYQPFLNLLVIIYQLLGRIDGKPDMGWAVIIFTIMFRIIILPISLSSGRSEKEKHEISEKYKEIEALKASDPIQARQLKRQLIKSNPITIISEFIDLFIQVMIALMLYRMFTTGLEGEDLHLLYPFVSKPIGDFNLVFMDKFDLSHPNTEINVINTVVIFVAEFLSLRFSPFPLGKTEKAALIVLPVSAFIFFSQMPAGKKLFITTTLLFTIGLILTKRALFYLSSASPAFKSWTSSFRSQITNKKPDAEAH